MYKTLRILGALIIIGPFVFGYSGDLFALGMNVIIGGAVIGLSIRESIKHDRERWDYWIIELLGFFLIGAPYMFGFSTIETGLWMTTIGGILLVILSSIRLKT